MVSIIAFIGDNVNSRYVRHIESNQIKCRQLTKAVAHLILASNLIADISADTHIDHSQILNAEILGVKTAKDSKSMAAIDILIDGLQLDTKDGQDEVVFVDFGAIQTEIYGGRTVSTLNSLLS